MENKTEEKVLSIFDQEYRQGLLLCWKIREGFRHNVSISRIQKYVSWYWRNHLKVLFEAEEKYIFTAFPLEDKQRKKAFSKHRKLKKLFEENKETEFLKSLILIEEELELHIRFVEKELLEIIREKITPEEVKEIEMYFFSKKNNNDWKDNFWSSKKVL